MLLIVAAMGVALRAPAVCFQDLNPACVFS